MACIAKQTKRKHTRPAVPKEAREAERVAQQMYGSLMADGAPKATPTGYIMGAGIVMKMLLDQAVRQGGDRETLRAQAMAYLQII